MSKYIIYLFFLAFLFTCSVHAQTVEQESVIIHCSKKTASPGDDVNYKVYIANRIPSISDVPNNLYVYLLDKDGNAITGQLIQSVENSFSGSLRIPLGIPNDIYFITAYTSLVRSLPRSNLFYHPLVVSENLKDELFLLPVFDREAYYPGDRMTLKVFFPENIKDQNIKYTIYSGQSFLYSNKTDMVSDSVQIGYAIDKVYDKPLHILFEFKHEKEILKKIINLPVFNQTVKVDLCGVEKIAAGVHHLLVYTFTDEAGNGFTFKGKLTGPAETIPVQSFAPGLGLIHFKALKNNSYILETSQFGEDREFEIPHVSDEVVQVTFRGTSDNMLNISCIGNITDSVTLIIKNSFSEFYRAGFQLSQTGMTVKVPENLIPLGDIRAELVNSNHEVLGSCYFMHLSGASYLNYSDKELNIKFSGTGNEKTDFSASTIVCPAEQPAFTHSALQAKIFEMAYKNGNQRVADYYLNVLKERMWNVVVFDQQGMQTDFYPGITGKAYKNDDIYQGEIRLLYQNNMIRTESDADGIYSFLPAEKVFEITQIYPDKKNKIEIHTDESFHRLLAEKIRESFHSDQMERQWELMMQNAALFENPENKNESQVKTKKEDYSMYTNMLDAIRSKRSFQLMGGQILFQGPTSINYVEGALIVIDGIKTGTDAAVLNTLSPLDVASISIFTDVADIQMYTALNSVGVIDIKTKRGSFKEPVKTYDAGNEQTESEWIPQIQPVQGQLLIKKPEHGFIYLVGFDHSGKLIMTGF